MKDENRGDSFAASHGSVNWWLVGEMVIVAMWFWLGLGYDQPRSIFGGFCMMMGVRTAIRWWGGGSSQNADSSDGAQKGSR